MQEPARSCTGCPAGHFRSLLDDALLALELAVHGRREYARASPGELAEALETSARHFEAAIALLCDPRHLYDLTSSWMWDDLNRSNPKEIPVETDIAQWHVTADARGWFVRGWHTSAATPERPGMVDADVEVHIARAVDAVGADQSQDLAWSIADHLSMEPVRLAADIVALHQGLDGIVRVLAVTRKNKPHRGRRAFPGGHLNAGETAEDAALREALEEVTVEFERDELHPLSIRSAPGRDPRGRYVGFPFLIRVLGEEPPVPVAAGDAAQAAWLPVDEVLAEGMAFDHEEILREALAHPAAPRR